MEAMKKQRAPILIVFIGTLVIAASFSSGVSGMVDIITELHHITPYQAITNEGSNVASSEKNTILMRADIYVDDDADPEWYDATHVRTIHEAIANASEGDTIFVYTGRYTTNNGENIVINKTLSLIGEAKNTTIIDGSNGYHDVVTIAAHQVILTGFTIENSALYSAGILILTANNSVIGNIITNCTYGIRLDSFESSVSYNTIKDNIFTKTGISLSGWKLQDWNTHTMENNLVHGKPLYYYKNRIGLDIPSDAGQVICANCSYCTMQNLTLYDLYSSIQLGFSSFNLISNTTIFTTSSNPRLRNANGIYLYKSSNNTLLNNTISRTGFGINYQFSHNNSLSKNKIMHTNQGAYSYFSCNNNVAYNLFSYNDEGIGLYHNSNNNSIINNAINNNQLGVSLLYYSNKNNLQGNVICNNSDGLTCCTYAQSNIISNNVLANNSKGIYFTSCSSENTVAHNAILNNTYGILLEGSPSNCIILNTLSNSSKLGIKLTTLDVGWGIVFSSDFNHIYHNSFINNSQHVWDVCRGNLWDNGYPSGGNYWDTYRGIDQFSGPFQNESGSDGIGDRPYRIGPRPHFPQQIDDFIHGRYTRWPPFNPFFNYDLYPLIQPINLSV
jgi:parallel beta-helix repeat protein